MKPYILQVAHLGKVSEGQYVAHIAIMDSDKHCFTGIPYKTIVVDAINEEFARKIADIRIEEMMLNRASEIDSIYYKYNLTDITKNYSKMYADIVVEMEKLRKKQENLLTALVKEAQQSAEDGLNVEELCIHVDINGENLGHFLYAVRTVSEEGSDDYLELKIMSVSPNEYEWISIYDFYTETAEKILSEIMENR
jgi:DNA/RNA-binding domain of Phe-tRNA-synthetase-like protein